MDVEDWQNSNFPLCELQVVCKTNSTKFKVPVEVVFDVTSSPPPTYDQTSILWFLGLYTHKLDKALKRDCVDDQGQKDCLLETSVTAAVYNYAQAIASEIIKTATSLSARDIKSEEVLAPMCYTEVGCCSSLHSFPDPNANVLWGNDQECKTSNYTNEEKLAEYLASMIIRISLKEVAKHDSLKTFAWSTEQSVNPHAHYSKHENDERVFSECEQALEMSDENMNTQPDEWTFEPLASSMECAGLLSQASLSSNPSLDYPDAPPSTPLVAGATQSRGSFCRKLKGGLAKEFLPSPPPPTPNKNPPPSHQLQRGNKETAEHAAEFMDRLMSSLLMEWSEDTTSANIASGQPSQMPCVDWPELSDYAGQLSADIIKCVTTSDERHDFIDELMRSLCLENSVFKENKHVCDASIALNDFAEQLSTDIVRGAIASVPSQIDTHKAGQALKESLSVTAECWAKEILEASYREIINPERLEHINTLAQPDPRSVKSRKKLPSSDVEEEAGDQSQSQRPTSGVSSLLRTPESHVHDPAGTGSLTGLAGALLATAFSQALLELQGPILHPGPAPVSLGPSDVCTSGSHRSFLQPSKRLQASLGSGNPGQTTGALVQADVLMDCALQRYAEHFALEVIDDAVELAFKDLLGNGKACSSWRDQSACWPSGEAQTQRRRGPVVRALLGHQTTSELKGLLIWAAASQFGIQTLTLVVPDRQLQAQFSRVAHNSRVQAWTVGNLMMSLLQYCTYPPQTASRGSSPSGVQLLVHRSAAD